MLDTIFTYATKILDLLILWLIIYKLFKYARNNFKLTLILKGIIIIAVLKFVSDKIHLKTVGIILEYFIRFIYNWYVT